MKHHDSRATSQNRCPKAHEIELLILAQLPKVKKFAIEEHLVRCQLCRETLVDFYENPKLCRLTKVGS